MTKWMFYDELLYQTLKLSPVRCNETNAKNEKNEKKIKKKIFWQSNENCWFILVRNILSLWIRSFFVKKTLN